jgi:ArsR family transcriptional regulator
MVLVGEPRQMVRSEQILRVFADPTRRTLLGLLRGKELSVSELVEVLGQPQSTVSRHLKQLRQAGLIRERRDGATTYSTRAPAGNDMPEASLSRRLLEWMDDEPLGAAYRDRLAAVLDRRRQASRAFFARVGDKWDALREVAFGTTFHLEAMVALLPSSWTVADIGSGTGYALPILARRFRTVVAVDPVMEMIAACRRRLAVHNGNVMLVQGDLARLPLAEESFDLALAVLVLHHAAAPWEALRELGRVLRVGGRVLIVEQQPHENESFRERMQDQWWGFDAAVVADRLRETGFMDVECTLLPACGRAADSPGLYAVTARRE